MMDLTHPLVRLRKDADRDRLIYQGKRMKKTFIIGLETILLAVSAIAADKPNILFCIADDASYAHFGANGCSWVKTPNFDSISAAGIRFTRAYTPDPKCSPSRACIITGRNPWQLEAAANHWPTFPEQFKTFGETLGEFGYHVAYTGKGWEPGNVTKGRKLIGPGISVKGTAPTTGIDSDDYAAAFDQFLASHDKTRPFFFWFGCHEPHRAYEYGTGVSLGGKSLEMIPDQDIPSFWPDSDIVRHDMLDYAFEIEWFDQHLGRMLESLKRDGLLENTLIVITSDNGMPFPRAKGHPYELSSHMPLAIMWPAGLVEPGRVCEKLVSFVDFAPTFLELAGITQEQSGMHPFAGRSLLPILRNDINADWRTELLQGRERNDVGRPNDWGYPVRSILEGTLLYIHNFNPERGPCGNPETGYRDTDGSPTKDAVIALTNQSAVWQACFGFRPAEELYDLSRDPDCMVNLMLNPEYKETGEKMRGRLFSRLKEEGDPRMRGEDTYFDQFPYEGKNRGLYEKMMEKKEPEPGSELWKSQSSLNRFYGF